MVPANIRRSRSCGEWKVLRRALRTGIGFGPAHKHANAARAILLLTVCQEMATPQQYQKE